jgi:hypothetical protein
VPATPHDSAHVSAHGSAAAAAAAAQPSVDAAELETLRREADGALLRCEMLQRQVEHERAVSAMLRCQQYVRASCPPPPPARCRCDLVAWALCLSKCHWR